MSYIYIGLQIYIQWTSVRHENSLISPMNIGAVDDRIIYKFPKRNDRNPKNKSIKIFLCARPVPMKHITDDATLACPYIHMDVYTAFRLMCVYNNLTAGRCL